ncbi:hypothetical protein [Streptomyces hydrogenans]|uniref:hypothetical protein n=1 Tax=Streptomyces hydrogenans TaxID=1873719 RepID=UPI0037F55D02
MSNPVAAAVQGAGRAWRWGWRWWVPTLAAGSLLVMSEISQLLGTLSTGGHFSYDMGALTGPPGLLPVDPGERIDAIRAWTAWAGQASPDASSGEAHLAGWLALHLALDFVFFAPALAFGLYKLLHRVLGLRKEQGTSRAVPCPDGLVKVLVLLYLLADLAETATTGGLVHAGLSGGGGLSAWAWAVTVLSWFKWLVLGAAVFLAVAVLVVDVLPVRLTRWFIRWQCGFSASTRSWTRHRVQLVAVACLAALVVLPGGGPLEQFPDIQRAWVHQGEDPFRAGDVVGPVITLLGLSLALWVAGRWALLDGEPGERRRAHGIVVPLTVFGATLLVVCCFWPVFSAQHWNQKFGALAIPLIALVTALAGLFVRGPGPAHGVVRPPTWNRGRVEGIGRALTIMPLLIASLGLVRSFARPVLLGSLVEGAGVSTGGLRFCFWAGVVLSLVVPPALHTFLRWWDRLLFGAADGAPTSGATSRRELVPTITGGVLLAVTAFFGVLTAVDPLGWGSRLRTLGVLSLFLTTVVLLCAAFVRRAETRMPYRAFRALRFRSTPIWLPVLAVLVTQSMLDTTGVYHAVRLKAPGAAAPTPPPSFSSRAEFADWYEGAAKCRDGLPEEATGNALPMLFVAAAGGGIRAAYWTSSGMDRLTEASPCTTPSVFGLSGVSGGSLGFSAYALSGHAPGAGGDTPQDTAPGAAAPGARSGPAVEADPAAPARSREIVRRLADEDALAANVAALLYRDGTRAFHGMNRMLDQVVGDRASVFERAWERSWPGADNAWEKDYFTVTGHPPHGRDQAAAPGPVLILNGTDVRSGCRIAVSAHRTAGGATGDGGLRCRKAVVSRPASDPQFTTATIDALGYTDPADCRTDDAGLRVSTAAHLSARFAYVSPSGTMYRCVPRGNGAGGDAERVAESVSSIDGGNLEGSGIAALLELWSAVEPAVADHNRRVGTAEGAGTRYVVPLLVFLDNHYSVETPEPALVPADELLAPLTGLKAAEVAARSTTLQQAALMRFSGPLPGLGPDTKVSAGRTRPVDVRSFLVAPRSQPQVTAPLGWVLSDLTIASMDDQMNALAAAPDPSLPRTAPGGTSLTAGDLATARRLLTGPLDVS